MSINLPNLCLPPERFSAENVFDGLDTHLPAGPGRKAERTRSGVRTQHRLVCLLNRDMCFTSSRGVGSLPFVLTESWLVFHFPALVETPGQRNPSPPEENQQCKGVGKWWVMFSAGGPWRTGRTAAHARACSFRRGSHDPASADHRLEGMGPRVHRS